MAIKFVPIICPNCGNSIKETGNQKTITCPQCNTSFMVDEEHHIINVFGSGGTNAANKKNVNKRMVQFFNDEDYTSCANMANKILDIDCDDIQARWYLALANGFINTKIDSDRYDITGLIALIKQLNSIETDENDNNVDLFSKLHRQTFIALLRFFKSFWYTIKINTIFDEQKKDRFWYGIDIDYDFICGVVNTEIYIIHFSTLYFDDAYDYLFEDENNEIDDEIYQRMNDDFKYLHQFYEKLISAVNYIGIRKLDKYDEEEFKSSQRIEEIETTIGIYEEIFRDENFKKVVIENDKDKKDGIKASWIVFGIIAALVIVVVCIVLIIPGIIQVIV